MSGPVAAPDRCASAATPGATSGLLTSGYDFSAAQLRAAAPTEAAVNSTSTIPAIRRRERSGPDAIMVSPSTPRRFEARAAHPTAPGQPPRAATRHPDAGNPPFCAHRVRSAYPRRHPITQPKRLEFDEFRVQRQPPSVRVPDTTPDDGGTGLNLTRSCGPWLMRGHHAKTRAP